MNIIKYIQVPNSFLQVQGKRFGIRGSLVGSIIFSIVDIIGIFINSYLLEIKTSIDSVFIVALAFYFTFLILFGSASTYFPVSNLGVSLAKSLEKDVTGNKKSLKRAVAKGALFGTTAVLFVCIPLLVFDFIFILSTGHGDFFVMLFRTLVAIIIAAIIGAYIGNKLYKQLI